jgi:hypothetical protein
MMRRDAEFITLHVQCIVIIIIIVLRLLLCFPIIVLSLLLCFPASTAGQTFATGPTMQALVSLQ